MTTNTFLQLGFYFAVLLLLAKPLGVYMASVYSGRPGAMGRIIGPVERCIYKLTGVQPDEEMTWRTYAVTLLIFNAFGLLAVYAMQRAQFLLPLNPANMPGISPDSAFNTASSFTSNTNWQAYGGETTMSHLTQMLALGVQNFLSAATGMAVLVALIRGVARKTSNTLGSYWVDLTRGVLYILLPLSFVLAIVLVSQGVVQTFTASHEAQLLHRVSDGHGGTITTQTIAVGPAASQIAIKQLGTNGGGFFNVNSAHPLENPTPISNFLQLLAILLIPAALCHTFGSMINDTRQGWAILAAMTIILAALLAPCLWAEQAGNPWFMAQGIDQSAHDLVPTAAQPGGNMEGKETRFGITNSVLWAATTTAASNGSVNAMHDSFTPLGGLTPMWLMQLGEVVFGGVGSGLYGMLMFVIVAVFIAGLMVGRTPEYLGKKIETYEMKMASLVVLIPCAAVLTGTALAVCLPAGRAAILNPGPHGFSEILYAFSSAGNNNGSAFAGLSANTPFYNLTLGIIMLIARYWVIIPVLAIAGSLAAKRSAPSGAGTLPTHTPLFVSLLIAVVIVVGALTFIPALALGPVVEHLMLIR